MGCQYLVRPAALPDIYAVLASSVVAAVGGGGPGLTADCCPDALPDLYGKMRPVTYREMKLGFN